MKQNFGQTQQSKMKRRKRKRRGKKKRGEFEGGAKKRRDEMEEGVLQPQRTARYTDAKLQKPHQ